MKVGVGGAARWSTQVVLSPGLSILVPAWRHKEEEGPNFSLDLSSGVVYVKVLDQGVISFLIWILLHVVQWISSSRSFEALLVKKIQQIFFLSMAWTYLVL